jgi:hypothetical protein
MEWRATRWPPPPRHYGAMLTSDGRSSRTRTGIHVRLTDRSRRARRSSPSGTGARRALTNALPGREWIPAHPCGERVHEEVRCDAGHVAPAIEPRWAQPTGRALWPGGIYSAGLPARTVSSPNQRMPGFGHSERRDELLKSLTMGQFTAHAVEGFELTRPHAVGPDGVVHRRHLTRFIIFMDARGTDSAAVRARAARPVFDNLHAYLWTGESGHPADAQT